MATARQHAIRVALRVRPQQRWVAYEDRRAIVPVQAEIIEKSVTDNVVHLLGTWVECTR